MADFLPPEPAAVAALMQGFPAPWCIAGGWALDLFLGRATRAHGDVDVAIFRTDQMLLRGQLAGWSFRKVAGGVMVDWPAGEWLGPPVHEVHASSPGGERSLEFLLNERSGGEWVFRRNPAVRCPADRAVVHSGLPLLCPAIVLLYKAKHTRAVDERDFDAALASLSSGQRAWLRGALQVAQPGHAWLARLRNAESA
jgi:hypothetical protein